MPPDFNFPFVVSVFGAFIAGTVMTRLYVWPLLRSMPRYDALRVLAALSAFRFEGMNFMVVGFVSPALSTAVASQIAWGDFVAAVLALVSIAMLTRRWAFAIPVVWIANLWGTADLLNAYFKGVTQVAGPGLFGAGIYIAALYVPLLLTAHTLAFMLLLKSSDVVVQEKEFDDAQGFAARVQPSTRETLPRTSRLAP